MHFTGRSLIWVLFLGSTLAAKTTERQDGSKKEASKAQAFSSPSIVTNKPIITPLKATSKPIHGFKPSSPILKGPKVVAKKVDLKSKGLKGSKKVTSASSPSSTTNKQHSKRFGDLSLASLFDFGSKHKFGFPAGAASEPEMTVLPTRNNYSGHQQGFDILSSIGESSESRFKSFLTAPARVFGKMNGKGIGSLLAAGSSVSHSILPSPSVSNSQIVNSGSAQQSILPGSPDVNSLAAAAAAAGLSPQESARFSEMYAHQVPQMMTASPIHSGSGFSSSIRKYVGRHIPSIKRPVLPKGKLPSFLPSFPYNLPRIPLYSLWKVPKSIFKTTGVLKNPQIQGPIYGSINQKPHPQQEDIKNHMVYKQTHQIHYVEGQDQHADDDAQYPKDNEPILPSEPNHSGIPVMESSSSQQGQQVNIQVHAQPEAATEQSHSLIPKTINIPGLPPIPLSTSSFAALGALSTEQIKNLASMATSFLTHGSQSNVNQNNDNKAKEEYIAHQQQNQYIQHQQHQQQQQQKQQQQPQNHELQQGSSPQVSHVSHPQSGHEEISHYRPEGHDGYTESIVYSSADPNPTTSSQRLPVLIPQSALSGQQDQVFTQVLQSVPKPPLPDHLQYANEMHLIQRPHQTLAFYPPVVNFQGVQENPMHGQYNIHPIPAQHLNPHSPEIAQYQLIPSHQMVHHASQYGSSAGNSFQPMIEGHHGQLQHHSVRLHGHGHVHHHQQQQQQQSQPIRTYANGWIPRDTPNGWEPGHVNQPTQEYELLKFTIHDTITPRPDSIGFASQDIRPMTTASPPSNDEGESLSVGDEEYKPKAQTSYDPLDTAQSIRGHSNGKQELIKLWLSQSPANAVSITSAPDLTPVEATPKPNTDYAIETIEPFNPKSRKTQILRSLKPSEQTSTTSTTTSTTTTTTTTPIPPPVVYEGREEKEIFNKELVSTSTTTTVSPIPSPVVTLEPVEVEVVHKDHIEHFDSHKIALEPLSAPFLSGSKDSVIESPVPATGPIEQDVPTGSTTSVDELIPSDGIESDPKAPVFEHDISGSPSGPINRRSSHISGLKHKLFSALDSIDVFVDDEAKLDKKVGLIRDTIWV